MDADPQAPGLLLIAGLLKQLLGPDRLGGRHFFGIPRQFRHLDGGRCEGIEVAIKLGRGGGVVARVEVDDAAIEKFPQAAFFIPNSLLGRHDLLLALVGKIQHGDVQHHPFAKFPGVEQLGQAVLDGSGRVAGLNRAKAGIHHILAPLRRQGPTQGPIKGDRGGQVGPGHDHIVEHKGEATHQARHHQGRQHHAPGGHADAAQGREFAGAREPAVGQQGGHQGGHRKGQHQEARQPQQQHLEGRHHGQARFGDPPHQLEHHPHRQGDGGEGRHAKQQGTQQLPGEPAIHQGQAGPLALDLAREPPQCLDHGFQDV